MERLRRVADPPYGGRPHTIRIEGVEYLRGHPSFPDVSGVAAVVKNEKGFVVAVVDRIDERVLLSALGGNTVTERILRIDVCDLLDVPQDIADN